MTREVVKVYGIRNDRRCLVIRDSRGWMVERYVDSKPKRKRLSSRKAAIDWAEAWHNARLVTANDYTVRTLWKKYLAVVPDQKKWRDSTMRGAIANWKRVEEVLGPDTPVNNLGLAHMDDLWGRLAAEGYAANQIRARVKLLQRVVAWGCSRDYASSMKVCTWEVPEVQQLDVAEYSAEDTGKMLAVLDYRDAWHWRPWAAMLIMAAHGFRINAVLHLKWDDVSFTNGTITLRAEHEKTKREWARPMTWDSLSALLTARWHADRLGKGSPWVFYGLRDKPWTYQAWSIALREAEKAAGVQHIPYRGAHGFRRMVVGDVSAQVGDPAVALRWIGDKDLRQAAKYRKEREDETQMVGATREVRT